MIPKIIHYCWLSEDPYPAKIKMCIKSWKIFLPDYEFMLWDLNRFDINSSIWVKQAYDEKKYAFAADYIRLYALQEYGGIYLDTDVEVIKSFNDLLDLPYFVCAEAVDFAIEAAVIGAKKGCSWITKCLNHYTNRNFIIGFCKFDCTALPYIISTVVHEHYQYLLIENRESYNYDINIVCVFPNDWFCNNGFSKIITKTNNTYCIHHMNNAWHRRNKKEMIRHIISLTTKFTGIHYIYRLFFKKKYQYPKINID